MFNFPAIPLMCRPDAFAESQLMFFYPSTRKGCGNLDYISTNALYPSLFSLPWATSRGAKTTTGRAGLLAL
jgi:hypothetical protein